MKRMMMIAVWGIAAGLFAQGTTAVSAKDVASQPAVDQMLLDDDGVCIVTAPDGSFQIFTRGTGVYQFANPKAELAARKVARLNAERNLAKFISTKVESQDSVDQIQKNSLTMSGDGKVQEEHPSLEDLETFKDSIKSSTKAVLNGLVVVESKKVPTEGGTGGMIQVTMVYSPKTARASGWIGKKMQDHQADLKVNEIKNEARVNAARQAAERAADAAQFNSCPTPPAAPTPVDNGNVAPVVAPIATTPINRPEHRVNKTDY